MKSITGYTFIPCVRSFTSPGIDTGAYRWDQHRLVSLPKDTSWQNGLLQEIAKVSQRHQWDLNLRPLDRRLWVVTTEPPRPIGHRKSTMLYFGFYQRTCRFDRQTKCCFLQICRDYNKNPPKANFGARFSHKLHDFSDTATQMNVG